MFSKKESQLITTEFWTVFGKSFPRKWILYDTKIKDFSFKFAADAKKARVSLDLEMKDEATRLLYFNKLLSLDSFLQEHVGSYCVEELHQLENGKIISRLWIEKTDVSLYNKDTWREIFEFFVEKMEGFETVFLEFEDYIREI